MRDTRVLSSFPTAGPSIAQKPTEGVPRHLGKAFQAVQVGYRGHKTLQHLSHCCTGIIQKRHRPDLLALQAALLGLLCTFLALTEEIRSHAVFQKETAEGSKAGRWHLLTAERPC